MLYLDTSILITVLTAEADSARAQSWFLAQAPDVIAISEWVRTEVASALSIKIRRKEINHAERDVAMATFARLISEVFHVFPVSVADFRMAGNFAGQSSLGLRAGDALHLAIADQNGATLVTRDRKLAEAAVHLCGRGQHL